MEIMFAWVTVFLCISIGLGLILLELYFIPGTTLVGLVGLGLSAFGVYLGYENFGNDIGNIIASISFIAGGVSLYWSTKSKAWEKFALKDAIDSTVNDEVPLLEMGDVGKTVSALRPMGKALFGDNIYEVTSREGMMNSDELVQVSKVKGSKIFVVKKYTEEE